MKPTPAAIVTAIMAALVMWFILLTGCGRMPGTLPPVASLTPTVTVAASATPTLIGPTERPTPTLRPIPTGTPAPTPLPVQNLLANGDFEGGIYQVGLDWFVPLGWLVFGQAGCIHTELESHPTHVFEGQFAARVWQSYNTCQMGLYQVLDALPGARYQLIAHGFSWSTDHPVVGSPSDAYVKAWIGIAPDGTTDPTSSLIVWSMENAARDQYGFFTVSAVASDVHITVFLRSQPDWPLQRSDTFWDGVQLYQVSLPDG